MNIISVILIHPWNRYVRASAFLVVNEQNGRTSQKELMSPVTRMNIMWPPI